MANVGSDPGSRTSRQGLAGRSPAGLRLSLPACKRALKQPDSQAFVGSDELMPAEGSDLVTGTWNAARASARVQGPPLFHPPSLGEGVTDTAGTQIQIQRAPKGSAMLVLQEASEDAWEVQGPLSSTCSCGPGVEPKPPPRNAGRPSPAALPGSLHPLGPLPRPKMPLAASASSPASPSSPSPALCTPDSRPSRAGEKESATCRPVTHGDARRPASSILSLGRYRFHNSLQHFQKARLWAGLLCSPRWQFRAEEAAQPRRGPPE